MAEVKLIHADCITAMKAMADCSVDSIVTDPPYELGFMGKSWDKSGIANNPDMWREALRVLKPGGHLLAFSGSRTYHRMTCAIEDAGFEVRDQIMWIYGSGFPKSHNLTGDWQGWGTALKPAHEPICVARKPLIGTVAANVLAHGTGAINVDACRVEGKSRPLMAHNGNSNGRKSLGGGVTTGAECIGETTQGRWPANLIHDGSEEVLAGFGAHGLHKKHSGAQNDNETTQARFFYCAKASKLDRDEGLDGFEVKRPAEKTGRDEGAVGLIGNPENKGQTANPFANGGSISRNTHPTVKPTELMRYLCRLVTQPGGVILDPFMGSGSTGKAAVLEGFSFIGIDMTEEYIAIAKARIDAAMNKNDADVRTMDLFA